MNNQLHVYSNLASAPDIPNQFGLARLFDKRVIYEHRGNLRYEHVYEITLYSSGFAEYDFIQTIDHGEVAE